MKATGLKVVITPERTCKLPIPMKLKGKKRILQKALVDKMSNEKFRKPLRVALKAHGDYTIRKCTVEKTRYSTVLLIDVIPATGGATIETYFTDLVTRPILEFCATEGGNAEELLLGVCFTYRGEVKSEAGNMYADVDFAGADKQEENSEDEE